MKQTRNSKLEARNKFETRSTKLKPSRSDMKDSMEFDDAPSMAEETFWTNGDQNQDLILREDRINDPRPFDLAERTAKFGEAIITFAKKIPENSVTSRLISQLVGAGTSVGANYCEAADCVSKKDFKKSIGTCRKESKETRFFLRMIASAEPSLKDEARKLWQEAKELNLIFGAIWRKP